MFVPETEVTWFDVGVPLEEAAGINRCPYGRIGQGVEDDQVPGLQENVRISDLLLVKRADRDIGWVDGDLIQHQDLPSGWERTQQQRGQED